MRLTSIKDIRREELIKAAFEIIKRDGLRAATVGNIAEAAGASKGIVHHYFEDKQDLIEQTMRYAHRMRQIDLVNRLRKSATPSARLWAVISIILDEKYLQSGFCKAWVSFHAQTYSHKRLARLYRAIHKREQSNLVHVLSSFLPREDAARAAVGIKAMVEGFRFRLAAVPPPDFDSRIPLVQVLAFLKRKVPGFDQSAALLW